MRIQAIAAVVCLALAGFTDAAERTVFTSASLAELSRARLPLDLTPAQKMKIDQVVSALRSGRPLQAQDAWRDFAASYFAAPANRARLDSIVDAVLREAVVAGQERRLLKKMIRDYLQDLRDMYARCTAGQKILKIRTMTIRRTAAGGEELVPGPPREMNCKEIRAEIRRWEDKLNSIGDDAQLATVDLQNALQKQQQTLQIMSNISKMLYDTAQAVIRKIGS